MTEVQTTLPPPKKRYEWIDNARIVAALLIIYVHIPTAFYNEPIANSITAINFFEGSTIFGRVPFFLVLAGYFLGRKITWHKAIDRAIWLFIPYFIWNVIAYVLYHHGSFGSTHFIQHVRAIPYILGTTCIFTPDITLLGARPTWPVIVPTWFLRDIIILSLLTPILARCKGLILAALLIISAFTAFNHSFPSNVALAPRTCFFYCLGVCLCNYRIDDAYHIFNKRFTIIYVLALATTTTIAVVMGSKGMRMLPSTILGPLLGAMLIAYSGVLVEKHLPKLSKRLAPCGPACFLVFVLHIPILRFLAPILPHCIRGTALVWLLPIPVCAVIIALFLLMKRLTPWLMPYLGHMKVPKKQPAPAPAPKAS